MGTLQDNVYAIIAVAGLMLACWILFRYPDNEKGDL